MTKLNREMWPSDPYECPYCFQKTSSMEALINHFEKMGHPKKYIHQRFHIDLSKRKVKLHNATLQQYLNIQVSEYESIQRQL